MSIERGEQWTCDHCGTTSFASDEKILEGYVFRDGALKGWKRVKLNKTSGEEITLCRECYDGYLAVAYYLHNMQELLKKCDSAGIASAEILRRATRIAKIQKERLG